MKAFVVLLVCIRALLLVRAQDSSSAAAAIRNFQPSSNIPSTVANDGTLDGRLDIRQLQVLPNDVPLFVNSWFYLFWLTLSDGSQVSAVANIATVDGVSAGTRAGLTNLAKNQFTGQGYRGAFAADASQLNVRGPNLTISSPVANNFSVMVVNSTVGGATFTLTVRPQGPNFYFGGMGIWNEGTGLTNEYAAPDMTVEGWVQVGSKNLTVNTNRSVSWYERQFGQGQAPGGWELFWLYLSNGVRIAVWHTRPIPSEIKRNIGTVWYPSGRHQVVSIVNNTQPQGAYQSPYNNITYHTSWTLQIQDPPGSFNIKCSVQNNELVDLNNLANVFDALWEGYAEGSGTFDGQAVTFYGRVEQYYGAAKAAGDG